jgi:hypothetical protein
MNKEEFEDHLKGEKQDALINAGFETAELLMEALDYDGEKAEELVNRCLEFPPKEWDDDPGARFLHHVLLGLTAIYDGMEVGEYKPRFRDKEDN